MTTNDRSPNEHTAQGPSPAACWLPLAALALHVLEEAPGFPTWATARFGTTSPAWFALSHVPVFGGAIAICWRASRPPLSLTAMWWLLAFLAAIGTNVLFHVGATMRWREYSPGVATAVVLYLPLLAAVGPGLAGLLGRRRAATSVIAGILLSAALTATLWLDVPIP